MGKIKIGCMAKKEFEAVYVQVECKVRYCEDGTIAKIHYYV